MKRENQGNSSQTVNANVRFLARKLTGKDALKAIERFERAITLETNFAPAYAELAYTYATLNDYASVPVRECMPKAMAAALRALELDDSLPSAHVARAVVAQQWEWDWPTFEAELQRAFGNEQSIVLRVIAPLAKVH